jgi:hypothetical protein
MPLRQRIHEKQKNSAEFRGWGLGQTALITTEFCWFLFRPTGTRLGSETRTGRYHPSFGPKPTLQASSLRSQGRRRYGLLR